MCVPPARVNYVVSVETSICSSKELLKANITIAADILSHPLCTEKLASNARESVASCASDYNYFLFDAAARVVLP